MWSWQVPVLILMMFVLSSSICYGSAQHQAEQVRPIEMRGAVPEVQPAHKEPQRLVAAALALTLGPFGAHRLYFGTDVKVPVLYGLTFGGFGVLVLIDLGEILFTKDLAPFESNDKVFMWSKGRSATSTPP